MRAARSSRLPKQSGDVYRTKLVVRRGGDGIFPVSVRIVFENNQEVRWQWDGRERWKMFEVDRPVRALTAEVDPERVLLLDTNYTNNTRSLAPKTTAAASKWSLDVAHLAAGSPPYLWLFHLVSSSRDDDLVGVARRRAAGEWGTHGARGDVLLTLLVALPLSLALRGMIAAHLGDSLFADRLAAGTSYDWWQEFLAQATGLGTTFVPSIIGFGAVLDNLGGLLDNLPMATTIAGATGAWLVLWSFLSGGVLDRYARMRPTRTIGFFAACGTHFWRFLRIGLLAFLRVLHALRGSSTRGSSTTSTRGPRAT